MSILPIIGLSPRNSYYSDPGNIRFAIDEILREHGKAFIMIADIPDVSNYLAYGENTAQAKTHAQEQGNRLKQRIHDICASSGYTYSDVGNSDKQVRIINWSEEIESNPLYQEKLHQIKEMYGNNAVFRDDVRETARHSLFTRMKQNSATRKRIVHELEKSVNSAVDYILAEFAFLEVAPQLFGGNCAQYTYHREWPVYEQYIAGEYDGKGKKENLDFKIVVSPSRSIKPDNANVNDRSGRSQTL